MFLYAWKRNLIKSKLHTTENRALNTAVKMPANGIAVLVNAEEFSDFERLYVLGEKLSSTLKIQLFIYSKEQVTLGSKKEQQFSDSDFTLWGSVKNGILTEFIEQPFRFLVSYYQAENVFLTFLTRASNAAFKIGFPQVENFELNHLTINTSLNEVDVFEKELIKYLKIVNRID